MDQSTRLPSISNNRLAKITYPSGGYHSYDYGKTSGIQNEDDGDMLCNHPHVAVLAKHECALANGSCSASPAATITSCQAGNPSGGEATSCYKDGGASVISPLLETTSYVYSNSFSSPSTGQPGVEAHFYPPLETSHTVYAAGSTTPLQKVEMAYSTPSSCPTVIAGGSAVLDGEWCDQAPSAIKTTYYAVGSAAGVAEHDLTPRYPGLLDGSKDLDFSGNTVRSSTYAYQVGGIYSTTSQSGGLYHVLEHVQTSMVNDTATTRSVTRTNTYDGTGNLVQVDTTATNAASTTVKAPRNSAGDMTSFSDAMQVATKHTGSTQLSYDAPGIAGCPSASGPGQPTKITNALNQSTLYAYDPVGAVACIQDANNQITRISHDSLGRVTEVDAPSGGKTTTSFTSSAPLTLSQSVLQGPSTTTVMDGLGRTAQQTLTAPEGSLCTETFYDADGNVSAMNDPHVGCSGSVMGSIAIQTTHDALGRNLVQTLEDGKTRSWFYSGPATTFTDEATHPTTRTNDALG